jgi:hypothetical protein
MNGTLYMGDGCFGVTPRPTTTNQLRWYLVKYESTNFILKVNVENFFTNITAINSNENIFDSFIKISPIFN